MIKIDIIEDIISQSNFKPDNIDQVKAFTNSYMENLVNINNLEEKEYIIYISGPVSNIEDYEARFNGIEYVTYQAYSAYNVYVINPVHVLNLIDKHFGFSYIDKIFICYALLSISNVMIYDNRDNKWENSMGTFTEISFAMGRGIEIVDYMYIKNSVTIKSFIISDIPVKLIKQSLKSAKEIMEDVEARKKLALVKSDDNNTINKEYEKCDFVDVVEENRKIESNEDILEVIKDETE